ncbi:MAG TPA: methylenetetrahydrofolate reductase, partial [Spirochaetia bacterium]|nr:methylenetetrahydrofolate reductase [Spirochaetia bacterium]
IIDFVKRIEDTHVPVIAGVWPLASYRNALFLHNEVPGVVIPEAIMERMKRQESKDDAREEGIRIAREIIDRVRGAVKGIQVSPPFGRVQTALDVIA